MADGVSESDIVWSAPEFIDHSLPPAWYVGLGLVAVISAILVFIVSNSIFSIVVVVMGFISMAVYTVKKPRIVNLIINHQNLFIAEKQFSISQFKAFSPINEGGYSGAIMYPISRVSPPLTIYFDKSVSPSIYSVLERNMMIEPYSPSWTQSFFDRIKL